MRDTFAALPHDFLRGNVECVLLSGVQKWVQNSEAYLIVLCMGGNIEFSLGDTATCFTPIFFTVSVYEAR